MRATWLLFVWPLMAMVFAGEAPVTGGVPKEAFESEKKAPAADKSHYHLFRPTPKGQMREMSTDRPDKTESPYTVDAGHFQIETDILNFSYDRRNPEHSPTRVKSYAIMPVNFKMGLTNKIDIQFVIESYNIVKTRDRDENGVRVTEHQDGFGDVTTRVKFNVWGNDGGKTALAIMPYIKAPTNQDGIGNDAVEGGLIVPLGVELPLGWGMGVMTELDFVWDDEDHKHDMEFVNTITFSHDIIGNLGGYIEFFSAVSSNGSPWVGTVDAGFTYAFSDDIQLDFGCNVGVTRAADDVNPFLGLSLRF